MRSSVLAAKRALRTIISAHEDFDGFLVRIGPPVEQPTEDERVIIDDTRPARYEPATQQGGLNESYVIPVVIETVVFGDDHSEAARDAVEDRIADIHESLITLLADDTELGGTVYVAIVEGGEGPVAQPTTDGWYCRWVIDVGVATRIF